MDRIEERIILIIDQIAPRLQAMAEDIFTHADAAESAAPKRMP